MKLHTGLCYLILLFHY